MGLIVIDPGLWTTVQDAGKRGYREWGVPVGGAFHKGAAGLANALAGNDPGCAALEFTLRGGTFEAQGSLGIALAGAPMEASIVGPGVPPRPLLLPASTTLRDGERLVLGRTLEGARTYLAVRGGFQTETRLGSRSTERPLDRASILPAEASTLRTRHLADAAWSSPISCPIRIIDGPDRQAVLDLEQWGRRVFRVGSKSNRIGLRLESTRFEVAPLPDRLSAPLAPGAIQIAGGQLIILGVAGGTMGGYPHVAHIISADLDRVAQLRPGDQIRFERVSLAEARELDRAARQAARTLLLRVKSLARDA
jgi:biotin-dependent carboxylase-like uncharacterized protein